MTGLIKRAALKSASLGWTVLQALGTAVEQALGVPRLSTIDGLLGGETDAWRFWRPPVLDIYSEYDLMSAIPQATEREQQPARPAAATSNSAAQQLAS
jgi:hypothetical protein